MKYCNVSFTFCNFQKNQNNSHEVQVCKFKKKCEHQISKKEIDEWPKHREPKNNY